MTNDERLMIFCDFDGTISSQDVVDVLFETYAEAAWRKIEEEWAEGRITARECLDRQMACTRVSETELAEFLREIQIDSGFLELGLWARDSGVPLIVFSDGFDSIIDRVFAASRVDVRDLGIRIFASHLEFKSGVPSWNFPYAFGCAHGCGTCKPEIIRRLLAPRTVSVFIGDGRSDRFAAECADEVFAKGWLHTYCAGAAIPYQPFSNLSDVLPHLGAIHESALSRKAL